MYTYVLCTLNITKLISNVVNLVRQYKVLFHDAKYNMVCLQIYQVSLIIVSLFHKNCLNVFINHKLTAF